MKYLKLFSVLLAMLFTMPVITSCSDDEEEPLENLNTNKASLLIGTWLDSSVILKLKSDNSGGWYLATNPTINDGLFTWNYNATTHELYLYDVDSGELDEVLKVWDITTTYIKFSFFSEDEKRTLYRVEN
ncbi:MAG: hypothetical protein IJ341_00035 [Bacteroidales bacterium]|nr:hypothetical protein [Bacteroidales bacterium]